MAWMRCEIGAGDVRGGLRKPFHGELLRVQVGTQDWGRRPPAGRMATRKFPTRRRLFVFESRTRLDLLTSLPRVTPARPQHPARRLAAGDKIPYRARQAARLPGPAGPSGRRRVVECVAARQVAFTPPLHPALSRPHCPAHALPERLSAADSGN